MQIKLASFNMGLPKPAKWSVVQSVEAAQNHTGLSKHLIKVVAYKESRLRHHVINKTTGDYGALQVHWKTAKALKIDVAKLIRDEEYSYVEGSKILKYFVDRFGLVDGIKRFNCGTRKSCINKLSVVQYFLDIEKLVAQNDHIVTLEGLHL